MDIAMANNRPMVEDSWKCGLVFSAKDGLSAIATSYETPIEVIEGHTLKISGSYNNGSGPNLYFPLLDANMNFIEYWTSFNRTFDLPAGSRYMYVSTHEQFKKTFTLTDMTTGVVLFADGKPKGVD